MANWKNFDELASYKALENGARVDLKEVMSGAGGAERVKKYSVPMAAGLAFNFAARAVDDTVLGELAKLAEEAELSEKFKELYEGAVINTGEKRLVLHHLCRGQLGQDVVADGVNKRAFYKEQQAADANAFYVDAGNFSTGTTFQAAFMKEALELRGLAAAGCDVTTIGVSEFDYGLRSLGKMLKAAKKSSMNSLGLKLCRTKPVGVE